MFQVMPESAGKIIGIRVTGKITDQDYRGTLIPSLEALFKEHGKVRLLCFLDENFMGFETGAKRDDAKFFLPHRDDFERMAIVGAPTWIELSLKLLAPLMQGDVKAFSGAQLAEAWEWLRT